MPCRPRRRRAAATSPRGHSMPDNPVGPMITGDASRSRTARPIDRGPSSRSGASAETPSRRRPLIARPVISSSAPPSQKSNTMRAGAAAPAAAALRRCNHRVADDLGPNQFPPRCVSNLLNCGRSWPAGTTFTTSHRVLQGQPLPQRLLHHTYFLRPAKPLGANSVTKISSAPYITEAPRLELAEIFLKADRQAREQRAPGVPRPPT